MRYTSLAIVFTLGLALGNMSEAGPVCDRVASVAKYIVVARDADDDGH